MQGWGFGLIAHAGLALCRLGLHAWAPVAMRPKQRYVLLECERCERPRALLGAEAALWIRRHVE